MSLTSAPVRRRSRMPIALVVVLVIAIAVAVGVANGGFGAFGGGAAASSGPSASVPGLIPADANVVAEGRAVPASFAEISVAGGGRVVAVPVAEGDTVAAGATLLELDHAAADAAVAQAEAGAAAAAAAVTRAEAGVDQAKAGVSQAQASRDAADAGVDQARAGKRIAQAAYDALPPGTPDATKRQVSAQIDQASAGISAALAQRSAAAAGVTAAQAGLRTARAGLAAAQADADRAAAAADQARVARDALIVTSPIAGTIVSLTPKVGDLVSPGLAVVRVADLTAWRFETSDLSETAIARIATGAAATVTVDGLPDAEIAGTVSSVGGYGAAFQGDVVFKVVVAPSGEVPAGLRWNMTVTIEITGTTGG